MRTKSFTYDSFSALEKDDAKLEDIIHNAKILSFGDATILKVKDFYLNNKMEGLYFVSKIENKIVTSIPLKSIGKAKFERTNDPIKSAKLIKQIVHVVDVKKIINYETRRNINSSF